MFSERKTYFRPNVAQRATGDVTTTVGDRDLAMQLAINCYNRHTGKTAARGRHHLRPLCQMVHRSLARFSNPAVAITDNCWQFVSGEFITFLQSRDIQLQRTAVYNPQQNDWVESFNRHLKYGVRTFNTAKKSSPLGFRSYNSATAPRVLSLEVLAQLSCFSADVFAQMPSQL